MQSNNSHTDRGGDNVANKDFIYSNNGGGIMFHILFFVVKTRYFLFFFQGGYFGEGG